MTSLRAGIILVGLAAIGLIVVHLRAQTMACHARSLQMENRLLQLRRQSFVLEQRLAQLRSPDRLCNRVEHMNLPLDSRIDALILRRDAFSRLARSAP